MKQISLHFRLLIFSALLSLVVARATVALAGQLIIVVEGNRTMTVGSDVLDFGTFPQSDTDQVVSGIDFGTTGLVVDDTAGVDKASWHVDVSSTHLVDALSGSSIPYTNLEVRGDDDGVIDVVAGKTNLVGLSVLSNYQAFSGSGVVSDDITIFSGDYRRREGEYKINPDFTLTIPGSTLPGDYENTLTITFVVN